MCRFQQLYCDVYGYVARCRECGHYQAGFNRTVLLLTEKEFQKFAAVTEAYKSDEEAAPAVKEIILPTPCKGVYTVLSSEGLRQLSHMLQTADAECKALSLLQLFESQRPGKGHPKFLCRCFRLAVCLYGAAIHFLSGQPVSRRRGTVSVIKEDTAQRLCSNRKLKMFRIPF